jgi:hypothetical protein
VRKADNLTTICEPIVLDVGTSTSHNPMGLHGLLQGLFYPFFFFLPFYRCYISPYLKIYFVPGCVPVRSKDLRVVTPKMAVFRDVMPCSLGLLF